MLNVKIPELKKWKIFQNTYKKKKKNRQPPHLKYIAITLKWSRQNKPIILESAINLYILLASSSIGSREREREKRKKA